MLKICTLSFLALSAISLIARADDPQTALEDARDVAPGTTLQDDCAKVTDTALKPLCTAYVSAKNAKDGLSTDIQKLNKETDGLVKQMSADNFNPNTTGDPEQQFFLWGHVTDHQKVEAQTLNQKYTADMRQIDAKSKALQAATDSYNSAEQNYSVSSGQSDSVNRAKITMMQNSMKAMRLDQDFNSLRMDGYTLGQKIGLVNDKIDKMVIGAYFQDKIGQLLNSDVFCSAVKNRCGTKAPHPIGDKDLESLFPGISASRRSAQTSWNSQHPQSGGSGGAADAAQ